MKYMKAKRLNYLLVILFVSLANICAQDWPQFLGPSRNSTSDQKGLLRSWPEGGPEVLWTVDLGIGYGGPVVKDGKIYILDRDDEFGDIMRSYDLSSGKELWNFSYESSGPSSFPGSRSVPIVDGNFVYSVGPSGDLYCFDVNTGEPVWNKNIWTDFGGEEIPRWAIAQCPLVYGDLLILASQASETGVVAYDKLSGGLKWTTPALGPAGYVSPAIVKVDGEDHVVMISASGGGRGRPVVPGKVAGINALSGEILWEYNWDCRIPAPSAFDAGEGRVLMTGAYRAGAAMIQVNKNSEGGYDLEELFKTIEFGSHTKPPILYEDHFYIQYSTNERRDGLVCMTMDGQIKWKTKREPAFDKGSMILVGDLILATDGLKSLYLIEPDTSRFKPIASAEILTSMAGDERMDTRFPAQNWAPIALADGKLLIRDHSRMMCVKVAE
jgi:hypothetical protein